MWKRNGGWEGLGGTGDTPAGVCAWQRGMPQVGVDLRSVRTGPNASGFCGHGFSHSFASPNPAAVPDGSTRNLHGYNRL